LAIITMQTMPVASCNPRPAVGSTVLLSDMGTSPNIAASHVAAKVLLAGGQILRFAKKPTEDWGHHARGHRQSEGSRQVSTFMMHSHSSITTSCPD
jgi:hypothetical protein